MIVIVKKKRCATCKRMRFIDEFHVDNGFADGHKKHCKKCANAEKRKRGAKKREAETKIPLIKCKICGAKLKNISNTHLKMHGMTMQEYKQKYNDNLFTSELLDIQKKQREQTIKKKYTEEEIHYLKGEKAKVALEKKHGMSISEFHQKAWRALPKETKQKRAERLSKSVKDFYKKLSKNPKKHATHKIVRLERRKQTNLQKYGVEFTQALPETKAKVKETLLKRYGEANYHNKEKAMQTRRRNYGKYYTCKPCFSWNSQGCFKIIEENLPNQVKCFYATNGQDYSTNEHQVYHKSGKVRFLDFYCPELKLWVEFDEHHHTYAKTQQEDKIREQQVKETIPGVKLVRISEEEWLENSSKALAKIYKAYKEI